MVVVNPVNLKIIIGFIILAVLLFGSGLMSASEVAYFSLRPEDIEKLRNNRSNRSKAVLKLYGMPEKLLSTILVANNTINVTIVLLAAFISAKLFDFSSEPLIGFIVEAIVITFLLLFFGEILPKVFASRNGIPTALFMAFPLTILIKILKPVTSLLIKSTSIVKKRTSRRSSDLSMDDLSDALELTSDELDEDEKILKGIVNFGI